jgi:hypothetical protein
VTARGFSIQTIGVILMVIGIVGLLISLLWMTVWADRRDRAVPVVDRDYPPTRRVP